MPPPLITLLLASVTAYGAYKWFNQKGARISKGLKRAQDELKRRADGKPREKDLGNLKLDPETGEYKPDSKTDKT